MTPSPAPEARAQPGPWRRDEYGHLVDANGKRLTFRDVAVHGGNYQPSIDEAVANTDLAMAAPAVAAERDRLRGALAFAASVIKSGEPWTDRCEEVIGTALAAAREAGS